MSSLHFLLTTNNDKISHARRFQFITTDISVELRHSPLQFPPFSGLSRKGIMITWSENESRKAANMIELLEVKSIKEHILEYIVSRRGKIKQRQASSDNRTSFINAYLSFATSFRDILNYPLLVFFVKP